MRILVCGGAGYIGSHACVVLAERGHDVVIADNFATVRRGCWNGCSGSPGKPVEFQRADLRDREAMTGAVRRGSAFDAVVHFAALKAVGESCERPLDYFDNNISGTITPAAGDARRRA